jgi:hypothetical protein
MDKCFIEERCLSHTKKTRRTITNGMIFLRKKKWTLQKFTKFAKKKEPDFIKILDNNCYPDNFFICLSDNNPDNPTVFGTDHEVYFSEISNKGALSEFLEQFYTKDEFLKIVTNYIENEKTDK